MTEDQIIAEAVRLTDAEGHSNLKEHQESVARHALRLAKEPEQDPAFIKAMAVWEEAWAVWVGAEAGDDDPDHKAAASVIMKHCPAPPQTAVEWAKCYPWEKTETLADVCSYILKMAGDTQ